MTGQTTATQCRCHTLDHIGQQGALQAHHLHSLVIEASVLDELLAQGVDALLDEALGLLAQ